MNGRADLESVHIEVSFGGRIKPKSAKICVKFGATMLGGRDRYYTQVPLSIEHAFGISRGCIGINMNKQTVNLYKAQKM